MEFNGTNIKYRLYVWEGGPVTISWAPLFDTYAEANQFIRDHADNWESQVHVEEVVVEA